MTAVDGVFPLSVSADHPALPGHFPGRPLVPGVLLVDEVVHGVERATSARVAGIGQVRFSRALRPDEAARVEWSRDGARVRFRVVLPAAAGAPAAVADGLLDLDGEVR